MTMQRAIQLLGAATGLVTMIILTILHVHQSSQSEELEATQRRAVLFSTNFETQTAQMRNSIADMHRNFYDE